MALHEQAVMENRKRQEQAFHDALRDGKIGQRWSPELEGLIQKDPLWSNMKYYAVERKSRQVVLEWFAANCLQKKALDYCAVMAMTPLSLQQTAFNM